MFLDCLIDDGDSTIGKMDIKNYKNLYSWYSYKLRIQESDVRSWQGIFIKNRFYFERKNSSHWL
jgi:hypothetical protein